MTHNIMKRTLAGVLAVLCVASYLPANVGTGGFIGGTSIVASADVVFTDVSTVDELKEAFKNGGNYKLTANIALTETINVTGADVTLDLNEFDVSAFGCRAFYVKSGSLTLTGNGTVSSENSNEYSGLTNTASVIRVGDGGSYTSSGTTPAGLEIGAGVTVASSVCHGISAFGGLTKETVNIYGRVEVTGKAFAITGNGNDKLVKTEINIYPGAYISSANEVAIYHPQYGDLNITGGTIIGAGGIEAKGGISTVSITGSDTIITATAQTDHNANGNGSSTIGYAIAAVANAGYVGNPQFNISGGTITGSVAILEDNAVADEKKGAITITGGTFNTDVSAYVAEGFVQQNGTVVAESESEFVISQNGTVTLTKDTTYGKIKVAQGVKAVIDLNGYNLSLALSGKDANNKKHRSIIVDKGASLEIKNTSDNAATVNEAMQTTVEDSAELTIGGGVTLYLPYVPVNSDDGEVAIYYKKNSTVNIDGTVDAPHVTSAVSGNHDYSEGATLNITGTVSATDGKAIYHPHDGTLNITGGTITGKTAIYARTGNINISDGRIYAFGDTKEPSVIANGADATGDALALQSHSSYGAPVVTITGGSFESERGKSVASYAYNAPDPVISITGGYFNKELAAAYIAEGYAQSKSTKEVEKIQAVAEHFTITTYFANNAPVNDVIYPDYYVSGDYTLPKAAYLDGYDFAGWQIIKDGIVVDTIDPGYSDEQAQDRVDYFVELRQDFTVKLSYTKKPISNWLNVYNGGIVGSETPYEGYYQASTLIKVKANPAESNKKFSHWKRQDGNGDWTIVSYNETYSFYMPSDEVRLEAVYTQKETVVEEKATAVIESVTPNLGTGKVAFVSVINVPKNCTFVKGGLVATSDATIGANVTDQNAAYVKLSTKATASTKNLKYTWTKSGVTQSTNWYVRGYVVYKDSKGVQHTEYSTAVVANINGIV